MSIGHPTPAEGEQSASICPEMLLSVALRMAAAMDQGHAESLWDSASTIAKSAVTREQFAAGVTASRTVRSTALDREWIAVRREYSDGVGLPEGWYASVELAVFLSGEIMATELFSFRLEADGIWRLTGYVVDHPREPGLLRSAG